jgi:RNA polymerase subunit RPABC4/transcription elongation factor Spt4
MNAPVVAQIACHRCKAALDAGDNFCRHCGASAHSATQSSIWNNLCVMLAMLFLVAGPFALPMLWRSRRYSLTWKYVLTFLVIAEAVLVVWLIWYILHLAFAPLSQALKEGLGT